jgi:hypothetical protein
MRLLDGWCERVYDMECCLYGCTTRTRIMPACAVHRAEVLKLEVKQPSLPGHSFDGLFTTIDRYPGDVLCTYEGEFLELDTLNTRYPGDIVGPYAVEGWGGMYVDAACKRSVGAYINHGPANAELVQCSRLYPVIICTRYIQSTDEIFIHYGSAYWSGIHYPYRITCNDTTVPSLVDDELA